MSTSTPMYTTLDGGLQTVVSEETMREWEIRAGNYDLPIVYLDFDGASISSASWTEGHYIQDEIEFDDIVVKNSGIKNSTIVSIVSKLNEWYSGQLVFTTEIPAGEYGEDYHTIFVGKTDAFGEYGNYLCVNAYWELEDDEGDGYIGFVLLDSAASTELLLNCIAHEACGGLWSGDDDGFFRAYCRWIS